MARDNNEAAPSPQYGVWADKKLGQHFLRDGRVIARIIEALGDIKGKRVVEIGPGPGVLTRPLLEAGVGELIVVEKDPRMVDVLRGWDTPRLRVMEADALRVLWQDLVDDETVVVGNLPYNVGTEIVADLATLGLRAGMRPKALVFMLQKEVVGRICAKVGGREWGRLGVLCQWLCEVEDLFDVAPGCFVPPPKVVSSVVKLSPLPQPRGEVDWKALDKVVRAGFGQRRKMLRAAMKGVLDEAAIAAAGIEPTLRAEQVDVAGWVRLGRALPVSQ